MNSNNCESIFVSSQVQKEVENCQLFSSCFDDDFVYTPVENHKNQREQMGGGSLKRNLTSGVGDPESSYADNNKRRRTEKAALTSFGIAEGPHTGIDKMEIIQTFVIFDIETTGLPHLERNQTKITELTFIAVSRKDLKRTPQGTVPPTCKLSLMLNPMINITSGASGMNGLTNELLKNCPTFEEKAKSIKYFLEDLPKPVCLVAHNGYVFDYKILRTECNEASLILPEDLLCVDSLKAFKQIEKFYVKRNKNIFEEINDFTDVLTDDEDMVDESNWPEHNSIQEMLKQSNSFKLNDVYERLYQKRSGPGSHRSEVDCMTLLDCVIAYQFNNADFIQWADDNCKKLSTIKPLIRK